MKNVKTPDNLEIIDGFDEKELETLFEHESKPCVSLYIPTHRSGRETLQNAVRFKNALETATELAPDIDWKPASTLLDSNNAKFWQYQKEGFALFASPDIMRAWRIPASIQQMVVTGDQFHVKPLMPMVFFNTRFFILAFSQNECRLYQCDMHHCVEIRPNDLPNSLSEALRFDLQEKQLQFHSGGQNTQGAGRKTMVFHGQGVANDEDKDRILRYFQAVNKALVTFLGSGTDPLILAGVDYLHALYKKSNTYPHLVSEGVKGNPENLKAKDLHKAGCSIVRPLTRTGLEQAVKNYQDLKGTGKATSDLKQIVKDAPTGRIRQLMVATDLEQWGRFYIADGRVEFHSEKHARDQDLLNVAACYALKKGASVFPVSMDEMPDDAPAVAIFHY